MCFRLPVGRVYAETNGVAAEVNPEVHLAPGSGRPDGVPAAIIR